VVTLPAFAAAWLRQRDEGARAVAAIEAEELKQLTSAQALAQADALLAAVPLETALDRRVTSGFVEQQRLFCRARK
jgi:hypothetical protein